LSTDPLGTGRGDHPSEVEAAPDIDHRLVVTAASRGARADLGPTAWAVLEDLALDGQSDPEGHLVAATNVRRIAIHLGISKDTAARALARLADAGLVVRSPRRRSTNGAFVSSAYVLRLSPGLGLTLTGSAPGPASRRPALLDVNEPVPGSSEDPHETSRDDGVASRSRRRRRGALGGDQRTLFELSGESSERR
jgi:DNA-binding transcriptional ArsR family regulator